MKRIFAWQTDTSTCHLYRTVFPFQELEKIGYEVSWGPPPPDIFDFDIVVGQRITGNNKLWRDLSHDFKGLLVLDLDDDLVDVDPRNTVPYNLYQPQRLGTIANIQMSDVVTVSTSALAEKAKKLRGDGDVVVLPNCAHPDWIKPNIPNGLTVGYAGSPFHAQDWTLSVHEGIHRFATSHPQTRFHSLGGRYLRTGRFSGMRPVEAMLEALDFWVGLAPLTRNEFNESKSWAKALEYGCRGIPIIASNVGQYPEWIQSGGGGLLVENESSNDWFHRLKMMMDPQLRADLSQKALDRASAQTIDKHAHLWDAVYRGEW